MVGNRLVTVNQLREGTLFLIECGRTKLLRFHAAKALAEAHLLYGFTRRTFWSFSTRKTAVTYVIASFVIIIEMYHYFYYSYSALDILSAFVEIYGASAYAPTLSR